MKVRIVLVSLVLVVAIAFCLSGAASAADTGSVIPIVNVDPSGSLAIVSGTAPNNNAIDFGNMVSEATTTKTLTLGVTANANWRITVSTTQNLAVGGYESTKYIPPDNFTFTSSGDTGPTYMTSDTPFRTSADGYSTEVTKSVATRWLSNRELSS